MDNQRAELATTRLLPAALKDRCFRGIIGNRPANRGGSPFNRDNIGGASRYDAQGEDRKKALEYFSCFHDFGIGLPDWL